MNKSKQEIRKVVIAGGGTAGWMVAASISKLLGKNLEITLIESDEIGTVGVGEATIPPLLTLHQLLKINESDFMAATNATFKLGINFENWRDNGMDYFHSFGTTGKDCWAAGFQHFWLKAKENGLRDDYGVYCPEHVSALNNKFAVMPNNGLNYAYHFDASLYAKFLRDMSEQYGVKRIEGKISKVNKCPDSGFLTSLLLTDNSLIEGDLFVDCTGFKALLIEGALNTGYDDWSHYLPANSAIAVQTKLIGEPVPYTRSIAHENGWQWQIPLQNRVGNGIVYCNKFMSSEDAESLLLNNLKGEMLTKPRHIQFTTGQRRKHWNKNCVAIGLSAGFIEPLESTSVHLIQRGITRLLQMFPYSGIDETDINEFNQQTQNEILNIRDFIILHYNVTDRKDSEFWRHCSSMEIPTSLRHRIEQFKNSGRVFKNPNDLFSENSWIQVMMGQGILPENYHPIVNQMSKEELNNFMSTLKNNANKLANSLPTHNEFISHYCKTEII
jgi:tryptophan halogenase